MILTVLADDFTGALDTGVQFAEKGIPAYVAFEGAEEAFSMDCAVLVIDMQSRHLPPEQARAAAFRLARLAREAGSAYLYKKTDSTLRGNIGAELEGAMRGFGAEKLCFAPAYPKLGRITSNGVQYVDGSPLTETSYARDALNPIRSSDVAEIIAEQSSLPVSRRWEDLSVEGIFLADAETDGDLDCLAQKIRGKAAVFAGCAGFAEYLDRAVPLEKRELSSPVKTDGLLVLSGSIHPRSLEQLQKARADGIPVFCLAPEEKLAVCRNGEAIPEILREQVIQAIRTSGTAVVASAVTRADVDAFDRLAKEAGIAPEEAAQRISKALGDFCYAAAGDIPHAAIAVFGGDTAAQVLRAYGSRGIRPLSQIKEGIPICAFEEPGGAMRMLITKAGGFGGDSIIQDILSALGG